MYLLFHGTSVLHPVWRNPLYENADWQGTFDELFKLFMSSFGQNPNQVEIMHSKVQKNEGE